MENKTHLVEKVLEAASKDKKSLGILKNALVNLQQYEFAAEVRAIEKEKFAPTEEEIKANEIGAQLNTLFRMVDLNISEEVCWLIQETLGVYKKKKGKFDLHDAVILKERSNKLFS